MPYASQIALKQGLIEGLLRPLIGDLPIRPLIPSPLDYGYRNKVEFSFGDKVYIPEDRYLALREAGRRLGIFLRRRERAASEFRRRNIFDLYIEEVVAACNRLKGGQLPTEKLKEQLHKIASSRTGGLKTDEALGKTGAGPEGLPNSIIVTNEGIEGDIDVAQQAPASGAEGNKPAAVESGTETKARLKSRRGVKDASHIRKRASAGGAKGTVAQQDLFVADKAPAKKRPGLKKKSTAATATRKRK